MDEFSHVEGGKTQMVDVTEKPDVYREATATGELSLRPETVRALESGESVAENVLATARIAAVQAVKRTWDEIPMCHQVPITDVDVSFEVDEAAVTAEVTVTSTGKTGVEMETLNGVTRALLTVWDMTKATEKDDDGQYPGTAIDDVRVVEKVKGEAGE